MTSFDYAVLAILGISLLVSMMRGFVREILSLVSWVAAFFVAKIYTMQLAPLLPESIPNEALKFMAAFLILFIATLLVCSLLSIALSHIFKKAGLTWLDRSLGAVFGIVRGLVIIGVLVLLAGLTSIPKDSRWQNAMFSAPLEFMVQKAMPWLPVDIAKHIKYD